MLRLRTSPHLEFIPLQENSRANPGTGPLFLFPIAKWSVKRFSGCKCGLTVQLCQF